ncbi:glycoside hydrolase family 5 protein [Desertivirga arenae]|uniref:glycoside hydrolase family 5 protein n=1 Tax=Desertivirga arenae TaxID=2810309 RepID=UPI001A967C11|nr:glycoside hydrolase family 5 protein [Pedobacter sp. SYSU D00823]
MRKELWLLIIAIGILLSCGKKGAPVEEKTEPVDPPPANTYSKPSQPFGVNLSGAEFGTIPGTLGTHYGYPTAADLDYFKAKGFKLIRFPFRWERIQPTTFGPLNSEELSRMKTFVEAAQSKQMLILLDMHNFCRRKMTSNNSDTVFVEIGDASLPVEALGDVWYRLANEFKGYNNIWGYDMMNEPYALTKATWFNIAQKTINKIRTIDQKTTIVVSGDAFSSASKWKQVSDNLKDLIDPGNNLIFQAHTYFDKDAGGSYKGSYDTEAATENIGVERVTPFVDWLKTNKLRGFVGEYGVPDNDPRWNVVLDRMLKYLSDNCVNGTYWSAGPRWGNYPLAVQPANGQDRPQMSTLMKYLFTNPINCK